MAPVGQLLRAGCLGYGQEAERRGERRLERIASLLRFGSRKGLREMERAVERSGLVRDGETVFRT